MSVAAAKAKEIQYGDFSKKKIADMLNLDRATVAKRLDALRYKPILTEAKLTLYRFDEAMEAALLETADKLTDVRVRKETAAAEKLELQVMEARGELASVAEFTDITQKLFGAMHKEVVVRAPKRLSARLAKAKTAAEVNKILTNDLNGIFKVLRDDWENYLAPAKK